VRKRTAALARAATRAFGTHWMMPGTVRSG
jgi:hypothetical protein